MTLYSMLGVFKDFKFIVLTDINNKNIKEETGGIFNRLRQYETYEDSYRVDLYHSTDGSIISFDTDYNELEDNIIVISPDDTYYDLSLWYFCKIFGYESDDLIFKNSEDLEEELIE